MTDIRRRLTELYARMLPRPATGACSPRLSQSPNSRTAFLVFLAALVLALGSLLPYLEVLPGLHADEAWVGLRAKTIAGGELFSMGMNDYTGPVHQYLSALFMSLGGFDVFVLRLSGVLLNVAGLAFAYAACRKAFGDTTAALYCLLLVCTPAFAMYSRMATEVTAATFFLAALSAYCLSQRSPRWDVAAGVVLAVGVWTHVVFAAACSAWIAVALVTRAPWRRWALVSVGMLPFAIARAFVWLPTRAQGDSKGAAMFERALAGIVERAPMWPRLFAECLHGEVLFTRHVGRIDHPTPPLFALLFSLALLACLCFSVVRSVRGAQSRALLAPFLASMATVAVMSPQTSDRYLLLPLYLAPLLVAFWLPRLTTPGSARRIVLALVIPLCLFQQGRTVLNFHVAHLSTEGGVTDYPFGDIKETSSHFVRSDLLYRALVERKVQRVHANIFITRPLEFYDLGRKRLRFSRLKREKHHLPPREVAVLYRGHSHTFRNARADSSFEHFTVFEGVTDEAESAAAHP